MIKAKVDFLTILAYAGVVNNGSGNVINNNSGNTVNNINNVNNTVINNSVVNNVVNNINNPQTPGAARPQAPNSSL